jgi:Ribbon-helix-helix protein, copG family.
MRKPVSLSLDEEVIEKLKKRANKNNRSLSREIETTIKKCLRL